MMGRIQLQKMIWRNFNQPFPIALTQIVNSRTSHPVRKGMLLASATALRRIFALSFLVVTGVLSLGAQTSTNSPSRPDFSAFRIISDRNIFNSRRSAGYVRSQTNSTTRSAPKLEFFALSGTMNYEEKGPIAFFEGSSSEYRKVVKPNEKIAQFTVTDIEPTQVKLVSPTNQLILRVGMQLNHQDGSWQISERNENAVARNDSGGSSPSTSTNFRTRIGAAQPSGNSSTNTLVAASPGDAPAPPDSAEPQEPATNTQPGSAPTGNEGDILERLRRRAAAERGE